VRKLSTPLKGYLTLALDVTILETVVLPIAPLKPDENETLATPEYAFVP
jgi:hypothetical protein